MRNRYCKPTLEALEGRVTPADLSALNFGGLNLGALAASVPSISLPNFSLPDFSGFDLSGLALPNLTDLGNGLTTLQLAAGQLANSNLLAGFAGLQQGPAGLFGLNDAALTQFQLESQGLTAGSNLFGNLGTFVSAADTFNNFVQGDFAGTAISGVGTAFSGLGSLASLVGGSASTLGPLGAAVSLGIGLGQNVGAPLLLSTQFGNNLVNNLSDTLLSIPGVSSGLLNLSNNFDSLSSGFNNFLGSTVNSLGNGISNFLDGASDFASSIDLGGFGDSFGGDAGPFDSGFDTQFSTDSSDF